MRGPRVGEIDVFADMAVDANGSDSPRGTQSGKAAQIPPRDDAVSGARTLVGSVGDAHESIQSRLHEDIRLDAARDQRPGLILLVLELKTRPNHRRDPFRPHRIPAEAGHIAIANLRHEAGVGSESAREVAVQSEPIDMRRTVVVSGLQGVAVQASAIPFISDPRTVRRDALAEKD